MRKKHRRPKISPKVSHQRSMKNHFEPLSRFVEGRHDEVDMLPQKTEMDQNGLGYIDPRFYQF